MTVKYYYYIYLRRKEPDEGKAVEFFYIYLRRKGSDIRPEVKKTLKNEELLYANECICVIYVYVGYKCASTVCVLEMLPVNYMVDIENP